MNSPKCKHFKSCGGCDLQDIHYEKQLLLKEEKLFSLLKEAIPQAEIEINKIKSVPFEYRNRIRFKIHIGKKCFSAKRSNELIEIEHCHLISQKANYDLKALEKILADPFFKDIKEFECFFTENHCYLALYSNKKKLDRKKLFELYEKLPKNNFSIILKSKHDIIHLGEPWIRLEILKLKFEFSLLSFFQTNQFILEDLIHNFNDLVTKDSHKVALDLFCGTGFLSLPLAKQGIKVFGYEGSNDSIMAAKRNAQINQLENLCEFKTKTLKGSLNEIEQIRPDLVITDPPRSGIDKELRVQLAEASSVKSLIYLSCNPITLVRDLKDLCSKGLEIKKVFLADMFPQTKHIETLVLLRRS